MPGRCGKASRRHPRARSRPRRPSRSRWRCGGSAGVRSGGARCARTHRRASGGPTSAARTRARSRSTQAPAGCDRGGPVPGSRPGRPTASTRRPRVDRIARGPTTAADGTRSPSSPPVGARLRDRPRRRSRAASVASALREPRTAGAGARHRRPPSPSGGSRRAVPVGTTTNPASAAFDRRSAGPRPTAAVRGSPTRRSTDRAGPRRCAPAAASGRRPRRAGSGRAAQSALVAAAPALGQGKRRASAVRLTVPTVTIRA